jgi:hypothetical protein
MDVQTLRHILAHRRRLTHGGVAWVRGWRQPEVNASLADFLRERASYGSPAPREPETRTYRADPPKGPSARA